MVCYRVLATLLLSVWHRNVFHRAFSCGVAKDCIASREMGMEAGVKTNKGSRVICWSAALFAAASDLAFLKETEFELLVWARHLQTAIEVGSKMASRRVATLSWWSESGTRVSWLVTTANPILLRPVCGSREADPSRKTIKSGLINGVSCRSGLGEQPVEG